MAVSRKRDPRQVSLINRAGATALGPGRELVSKPKARPHRRGVLCKKYPLMHLAILFVATREHFRVRRCNVHAYVSRYFPEIVSEYAERNGKPPGKDTLAQRT